MSFHYGNAKSENSSKRVKFKDEYGNIETSSECSGSSKDSDDHSEGTDRVEGTKSKDLRINSEIIRGSGNKNYVEIQKGENDKSGSSKRSEVIQGEEIDGSEGDTSTEKTCSSASLSSSYTDDQSQSDTRLSPGTPSGNSSSISKQCQNGSEGSTSNSLVSSVSLRSTLTQSPPMQVMDRKVGEFDPNRIPSVVFASSKPITPMDWSLASNDSLFSLKLESAIFLRDPYKQSGESSKRSDFKTSTSSSAVSPVVDTKSFKMDKIKETVVSDDVVKDKTVLAPVEPIVEQPKLPIMPWKPNISNHPGENGARESPFDFPVKNKKNKNQNKIKNKKKKKKKKWCAWPSCSCSGCSWTFCYCSNYSCALCYCWNCSLQRWCCDCCSDSEDEINVPEKEKAQQKQKHQEKPSVSPLKSKSTCSNCFSCYHCSSEDENNVPEREKTQHKQKHKQQEKPLASAFKSKSACTNCCSWFSSCRWRCKWSWCCFCNCFRGKCLCCF